MTTSTRGVTDGAGDPKAARQKGLAPDDARGASGDLGRSRPAWTHDAAEVIAHIERGRDEADRELPPRVP